MLFNVCEVVKTTMQGEHVEDLNEPMRKALEDLERCAD